MSQKHRNNDETRSKETSIKNKEKTLKHHKHVPVVKRSYHDDVVKTYKEKVENAENKVFRLKEEIDSWKSKYENFAHDLENRFQKKMEEMNNTAKQSLQNELKRVSSEVDNRINNALSTLFKDIAEQVLNISYTVINIPEDSSSELKNYAKGFHMLIKQLEKVLVQNGLKIVYPKINDVFNPSAHHAISKEYSIKNIPSQGIIIEVISPQYLLNNKTISYANVKVAVRK